MATRNPIFRSLGLAALAGLALAGGSAARAQFSYTYYPNNSTINSEIATDYSIVGYAGGGFNDDFTLNFTGASSPAVNVVDGAQIDNELDSFNASVVNVNGGSVSGLVPWHNSTINMNAGVAAYAISTDHGTINMTGGYISDLEGQGAAINVSGGLVDSLVANTQSSFSGDDYGSCLVTVTGGAFNEMDAFNRGILDVHGGTIGAQLFAAFGGTVNVYGAGLNASLVDPNFSFGGASTYHFFSLSGTLADGTTLTETPVYIRNDSPGDGPGISSLHIFSTPEPGAASLLMLGSVGPIAGCLVRRRRSGRSS